MFETIFTGDTGAQLIDLLRSHGLILLFPLVVFEGPVATLVAAWLARQHQLDLLAVTLVCMVADMTGDVLFYSVGRSGRFMSSRLRARLDGGDPVFAKLREQFSRRGGTTILIGKFTWSVGVAVILTAGAVRMPLPKFLAFSALVTVPKTLLLIALGWWIGGAWRSIESWLGWGSLALVASIGIAWYLLRERRRRRAFRRPAP